VPQVLLLKTDNPLGPGGFVEDNRFLLTKEEWYAVQRYVGNAMALPITEAALRIRLNIPDNEDISQFSKLIDGYEDSSGGRINGYKDVYEHAEQWKKETYPFIVSLAHDLRGYADGVPASYGDMIDKVTLLDEAAQVLWCLENNIPPFVQDPAYEYLTRLSLEQIQPLIQVTTIQLSDLLKERISKATEYAEQASSAEQQVDEFKTLTEKDKSDMELLLASYSREHGEASEEMKEIRECIEGFQKCNTSLSEQYEHAVIVAATTPTYGWIFPLGTMIGATVAGIYGDKARQLRNQMNQVNEQITALETREQRVITMEGYLKAVNEDLQSMTGDMQEALVVLGKMKGAWEIIATDLQKIVEQLEETEKGEIPLGLQKNLIRTAIGQWDTVNEAATGFVYNAYVDEEPSSHCACVKRLDSGLDFCAPYVPAHCL
jgi:hypothetical protein